MKVSRQSWHYRWWNFWNNPDPEKPRREPKNLCSYFWANVFSGLFTAMLASALAFGVGFGLWWAFVWHTVTTLVIVGLGATAFLISFASYKFDQHMKRRPKKPDLVRPAKPEKPVGPLRAYLRARKQKVCPLIEVVD